MYGSKNDYVTWFFEVFFLKLRYISKRAEFCSLNDMKWKYLLFLNTITNFYVNLINFRNKNSTDFSAQTCHFHFWQKTTFFAGFFAFLSLFSLLLYNNCKLTYCSPLITINPTHIAVIGVIQINTEDWANLNFQNFFLCSSYLPSKIYHNVNISSIDDRLLLAL